MTTLIPLSSITIPPTRQRRVVSPESLQALATSISDTAYGLLHPLVIRRQDGQNVLVAGERRLRAIQEVYSFGGTIRHANQVVPREMVPVVDLSDLDHVDAFEAELEENVRREDLTIVERAQAVERLFELRKAQAEKAGRPPPTMLEFATSIHGDDATVNQATALRNQILIARSASDEDVRKATSVGEAVKVIQKKITLERRAKEAEAVGATFTSSKHLLLNEDCLKWFLSAQEGQFEIILTDPPYGIGADTFDDSGAKGATDHKYDDSYERWQELMEVIPEELFRVAAPNAHAYLFCDIDRFHELKAKMEAAGWRVHRTPLIWHNLEGFRVPWQGVGPQRSYELILFAVKGQKKSNWAGKDVLSFLRGKERMGHPAQKPTKLLEELLRRSATATDRVFDPFAGTASTVEASHTLNLACTAIEQDLIYYAMALERVQGLEKELFG